MIPVEREKITIKNVTTKMIKKDFSNKLIEVRSNWSIEDIIVDVDLLVDKLFLEDSLFVNWLYYKNINTLLTDIY